MAAEEKKKPGLALVVSMGKGSGKSDEGESDDGDEYGAAVDELADVLGVAEEKRDAFRDAFEAACMSCK